MQMCGPCGDYRCAIYGALKRRWRAWRTRRARQREWNALMEELAREVGL